MATETLTSQKWRDKVYLKDPYAVTDELIQWIESIGLEVKILPSEHFNVVVLYSGEIVWLVSGRVHFCQRAYQFREWFQSQRQ